LAARSAIVCRRTAGARKLDSGAARRGMITTGNVHLDDAMKTRNSG